MGPKQDKGKKKAVLIEGVDTTEMTFPQLQLYTIQLYEKLLKERQERTYFQLERDKLRTFWEICRRQLDEARAQLRNQDHDLELAEEKRLSDLREVDQKVKFLQYEQNLQVNELIVKEKNTLHNAERDYHEQELELLTDKKELKQQLKTTEELHVQENKTIRLQHGKDTTDMRNEFEKTSDEMEMINEKRLQNLKNQLETKQKVEILEIEERKNKQIMVLQENHSENFDEIRNYYNNITLNNFSLITNLKENIEEMKRREAAKDKHLREVQKENKGLNEHLRKTKSEVDLLKHQVANYKKETIGVNSMKKELAQTKIALDKLKWDYDVLSVRFESNRDEKTKSDADKILQAVELQLQAGGRICYLEEKIKVVKGQVERRDHVISEVRTKIHNAKVRGDRGQFVKEINDIIQHYDELKAKMTHRPSILYNN